jgi:hypothetical protein
LNNETTSGAALDGSARGMLYYGYQLLRGDTSD